MSDNHEWDSFATNLAALLYRSPDTTILILDVGERFLDFSKSGDCLVVNVCDDLSEFGRRYLRDAGWRAPESGESTWRCGIWEPEPTDYRTIALAMVEVLRQGFSVTSPMDVHLDGWVDGDPDCELPLGQLRASDLPPAVGEIQALLSIAEMLLSDHWWLVTAVRYSLQNPAESHHFGPWRGFLSALGEPYFGGLGVLAQFDWKQDPDQVRDMLQRLPSHPGGLSWEWYPGFAATTADWHSGDSTVAFLDRVAEHCRALGFALVSFDTDSDDYAVTFLPIRQVERLSVLTAEAGRRVRALPFHR
ncbi:hypothetical protein [Nocardia sp. NPDC050710]|uniref:DUF6630 family protein n=1 Tax=Nocardia sp. NPDC050710 TaxID=3157220 RepID=UPI003401D8BC